MALYNYNGDFFKFVNDLIDGKVDGDFNTSANTDQELGIDNFNGTVFNGLEDLRDQFWSELLEYMYKEDDNLNHSIVRDNDWAELTDNMETVFQYINNHADLDNGSDSTFYTKEQFNLRKTVGDLNLTSFDTYDEYVQVQYLSYIQNYIDESVPHWNESLTALVDYYQNYFGDNQLEDEDIEYNSSGYVIDSNGKISMGTDKDGNEYVNFRVDDIVYGDAGNYFGRTDALTSGTYGDDSVVAIEDYVAAYSKDVTPEEDNNNKYRIDKPWVRPWFNIDKSTYSIERGKDKIKRVLNDNRNLQFTRYKENEQDYINAKLSEPKGVDATLEKYLRLIMPMYERIVEVEDLDRNFWVIAQVLGGLSAYVLGDDSPIGDMFAGLADEVVQLWENVLYLWVAMGLISQEPYYTDIKKLFIPVYNSEIEPYVKFDNFTEWSSNYICNNTVSATSYCENILKKIWEGDKNIVSLKDEYSESNLVILPEVRQKNYFENYYAQVVYPGMIVYNRSYDKTYYITFSCKKILDNTTYTTPIYIDLSDKNEMIREYLVGFQEDEVYYDFVSFQEPETLDELYRAAIRTTVDLDVLIDTPEVQIDFSSFSLNFYDVARELAGESNCLAGTAESSDKNVITINGNKSISFNFSINSLSDIDKKIEKTKGYYLGEVVSYLNIKKFEIESYSLEAITYNPQNGYTIDGTSIVSEVSLSSVSSYINYMSDSGKTSWETIVKNKATSDLTSSGTAKLYYCNSGYYNTNDSGVIVGLSTFEMKPYITFAVNKNGTIYCYHFTQEVVNNGLNSSISYPYISSIYQGEGGVESESIGKLCLFPHSSAGLTYDSLNYKYTGETSIYFVAPQNERYYTSDGYTLNTVGISIYGNMDIYYDNPYFYLKNYAIIMVDRCRLSTTSAIQAVPYYYLCEVTSAPSINGWGKITCTYQEGTSLSSNCYGSTGSGSYYTLANLGTTAETLTTYYWKSGWQSSEYMNNYSDVGKDEYLSYSSKLFRNDFEGGISGFDFDEYNVAGGV